MNQKSNLAAVIAYITWVGFFVALLVGDRNDDFTRQHLNQALVLNIGGILSGVIMIIPLIGTIAGGIMEIAIFVLDIMGIVRAATWSMEPLPFISNFRLI
jgi:uncharacterized membrane protein